MTTSDIGVNNSLLISLVKQYPVLWDSDYIKNREAVRDAWAKILAKLKPDIVTESIKKQKIYQKIIIEKFTKIRFYYKRSLKKAKDQKRLGGKVARPYIFSKKLSFLTKMLQREINASDSVNEDGQSNKDSNDTMAEDTHNIINLKIPINTNTFEAKMMNNEDSFSHYQPYTTDRHLLFFKAMLPYLHSFNEDQILQFQMGVLQLVQQINNQGSSTQEENKFPIVITSNIVDTVCTIKSSPKSDTCSNSSIT